MDKLKSLGFSKDQLDSVEDLFKELIQTSYVPLSQFESIKQEKEFLTTELTSRDEQLKNLKKSASESEELIKKIDDLQKINKETSQKYLDQIHEMKLTYKVESYLKENGARNIKSILPHLDMNQISLTDKDELFGLDKQVHSLIENEETSFLFSSPKDKEEPAVQESTNIQVTGGFKPVESVKSTSKTASPQSLESIFGDILSSK